MFTCTEGHALWWSLSNSKLLASLFIWSTVAGNNDMKRPLMDHCYGPLPLFTESAIGAVALSLNHRRQCAGTQAPFPLRRSRESCLWQASMLVVIIEHFILPPTLASADENPQQWFDICKKLQTTSLAPAKKCSQDCFNGSPRCTKYVSIEAGKPETFCSSSRFENIHKTFDANCRVSVCKDNHAFHMCTFHLVLAT